MSHKVDIEAKKVLKTEIDLSLEKSSHLEEMGKLVQSLQAERMKENQLTEELIKQDAALYNIREMIGICNREPDVKPYRFFPGNWAFEYSKKDGMERLYDDQKKIEQEQSVLKTQRKFSIERQLEILSKIHRKTGEMPTLECFKIY